MLRATLFSLLCLRLLAQAASGADGHTTPEPQTAASSCNSTTGHCTDRSDQTLAARIDQFATLMFACHNSTAMSLAVIKDGRLIFTKGYGTTKVSGGQPVTSSTRFAIGSLTKAFTATVIARWLLQQHGNITLDTPIQNFYPAFRLADEVRSRMTSFRDLLAHRMGIPGYFTPLMLGFPKNASRADLVRRLAHVPTSLAFRNIFLYNNYMYMAAGHVLEQVSGNLTWEEMVRDQILVPLNMSSTGFFQEDQYAVPNFALGCAMINQSFVDVPPELFLGVVQCGPAGGIFSSAEDMAKWMTFLLTRGKRSDGKVIMDPKVVRMTWIPSMLPKRHSTEKWRPLAPVSHAVKSYNLGWMTAYYRGYRHIFHTGGIVTHSARLWLFPDQNSSIYLSVNGPQVKRLVIDPVLYYIADELLGEPHWFDSATACAGLPTYRPKSRSKVKPSGTRPESDQSSENQTAGGDPEVTNVSRSESTSSGASDSYRPASSPDTNLPYISAFVGSYSHACFGTIYISLSHNRSHTQQILFEYGRFGRAFLTRVSRLDFKGKYHGPLQVLNNWAMPPVRLNFSLTDMGEIDAVLFPLDGAKRPVRFDRSNSAVVRHSILSTEIRGDVGRQRNSSSHQRVHNGLLVFTSFVLVCFNFLI